MHISYIRGNPVLENEVLVFPVCDLDLRLAFSMHCPEPPRFWFLLSLRPTLVHISMIMVTLLLVWVGMWVEPVEMFSCNLVFTSKLRCGWWLYPSLVGMI